MAVNAESEIEDARVARRRRRRIELVVVTAAVIAILIFVLPLIGAWGLPYHWACERESELGYADFWTPLVLLNSPFQGTANATGTLLLNGEPIPGAAGSIEATNGSSVGLFGLVRYLIFPMSTYLEFGAGRSAPCTAPMEAVVGGYFVNPNTGAAVTPVELASAGRMATQGVQAGFTLDTYHTVGWGSMDYNFSVQPEANLTSCESIRLFPVYDQLNVTIQYEDSNLSIVLTSLQVFYYNLPPPGNWLVQNTASGTWAFDFRTASC